MRRGNVQTSNSAQEHSQRLVERVTSQLESIPPDSFLVGAALSVGASLALRVAGRYQDALFVGQWAPTLLLVGLFSKVMSAGALIQESSHPLRETAGEALH